MTETAISFPANANVTGNPAVRPGAAGVKSGFKQALEKMVQTEPTAVQTVSEQNPEQTGELVDFLLKSEVGPDELPGLIAEFAASQGADTGLDLTVEEQEELSRLAASLSDNEAGELDERILAEIGAILSKELLGIYSSVKASAEAPLEALAGNQQAVLDLKMAKIIQLMEPGLLPETDQELAGEMARLLDKLTAKLKQPADGYPLQKQVRQAAENESEGAPLAIARNAYIRVIGVPVQPGGDTKAQQADLQVHTGPVTHQSMGKLEQFVIFAASKPEAADQEKFIKQFQQILGKANFTAHAGMQKLMIRLNPEHLGSMRIELFQKDSVMTARIIASTQTAKEMLESQLNGLKQSFTGQGIQIEKIEISQQEASFSQEKFNKNGSESSDRRKQEQDEPGSAEETQGDFTGSLAEALLNIKV